MFLDRGRSYRRRGGPSDAATAGPSECIRDIFLSRSLARKKVSNPVLSVTRYSSKVRQKASFSSIVDFTIMSVKKLINLPESCVDENLFGLSRSYPGLVFQFSRRTVFNGVPNGKRKVGMLSGGGSGHEPFPSGYVGEGMLAGSVSGPVFASPPKANILHAIRELSATNDEVLVIVPNYTGDKLNFGLAIETARKEGIRVESIIVGDDIALEAEGIRSKSGRRGISGLVLVLKVGGYLSKEGESLEYIKTVIESVTGNLASIGVCIEPCSLPGSGRLFHLEPNEMELGVGVHGEAGVRKIGLKSAGETVGIMLEPLFEYLKIKGGDELVALINNLGSLSQMEQWIIAGEVQKQISEKNVKLLRMYAGPLFTSLDMAGVQVSLLKVDSRIKELILSALDDFTPAPAWPGSSLSVPSSFLYPVRAATDSSRSRSGVSLTALDGEIIEKCLMEGSRAVIDEKQRVNELDSGCGDGDCGTTIACFAKEILKRIEGESLEIREPKELFVQLGEVAEESMGGTSGAIYGLFLVGASEGFSNDSPSAREPKTWARAWSSGIDFIHKYSDARVGDRTLLDALEPACKTFQDNLERDCCPRKAFALAVESAKDGCSNTRHMVPKIGRASYSGRTPSEVDAGAFAVCLWLNSISNVLRSST